MSTVSVTNLKHESASGNNITLDSNGRVGIGTTSPSRQLHVSGSGSNCAIRIDNTVSGRPALLAYDDSQNLVLTNSSDTGYFAFVNGTGAGTERIRVDSAGRVTTPYQPSFRVGRSGGSVAVGNVIIFNQAFHNIGAHYNTSNGRFTAPIAGRYLIGFSAFCDASTNTQTYVRKNGSNIGYSLMYGATYGMLTQIMVIDLSVNDYIDVYVNAGSVYASGGSGDCTITGQLLG